MSFSQSRVAPPDGHVPYHTNRHRTRSSASSSYGHSASASYGHSYTDHLAHQFHTHNSVSQPPSKRRRSETTTWHPDGLPTRIAVASSSNGTVASNFSFLGDRSVERDCGEGFMSRDEIDRCSPSRKDGIDSIMEARLRNSYCSYLKNLGMRLALPQTTIATTVVLCHRFFLRRSHACHDRFIVATAALFLASKSEETPCLLNTVLRASFEVSQNPEFAFVPYMIHNPDWFEQYRERVIEVEQMILTTLDFELEVKHPYAPLASVLGKLGLSRTVLFNVACNLVTEGIFFQRLMCSTMC